MSLDLAYDPDLSRFTILGSGGVETYSGFESGVTGWTALGGTIEQSADFARSGEFSALVTPDGVTATVFATMENADAAPVLEGVNYFGSGWAYAPAGLAALSIAIVWRDAADVVLSTTGSTTSALPAGAWTNYVTPTAAAPANATKAELRFRIHNTPTAADILYMDDMAVIPSDASYLNVEHSLDQIVWEPVRGGLEHEVGAIELSDYEFTNIVDNFYRAAWYDASDVLIQASASESIAAEITRVWLKSCIRPFLNQPVFTTDNVSPKSRAARNAEHAPIGRNLPIAQTDARMAFKGSIEVHCETQEERDALDYLLLTGDILFVHCPADFPWRSFYATVGDTDEARPGFPHSRLFSLPLNQCAPPGPDIVGATTTWEDVVATYATWEDVVAAKDTWEDLVRRIADPSTVIVS